MSVSLAASVGAFYQSFLPAGLPNNAGTIDTFLTNTTTPAATFTSVTGATQNSNPIVLGADGRVPFEIFLTDGIAYTFVLKDALGNTLKTQNDIVGIGSVATTLAPLAAPGGSALVGFLQAGAGAVPTTAQAAIREIEVSVSQFGAVGDNATNDTAAIQLAINALIAKGGGTLLFPNTASNTYYLGAAAAGSVNLPTPVAGANFTTINTAFPYHFYLLNPPPIRFKGDGVFLRSAVTNGGHIVLFDGARDIVWDGIKLQSVMSFTSATGVVIQAGMGALAFTSTTRSSERIRILNLLTTDCYTAFYTFGDPASAFRVSQVELENVGTTGGEYGIATHDNGDLITMRNVHVSGVNARAYFAYGVDSHRGDFLVDGAFNNLFGLFLIKAYDRDITNIDIKFRSNQKTNANPIAQLVMQSQHHVATQPLPKQVRNVRVNMDDTGNTTGGAVQFDYLQDAVVTATSANPIFDNIILSGHVQDGSAVQTSVVQTGTARTHLNVDDLIPNTGAIGIMNAQGFYRYLLRTYVPTITINGSAAGITYTTQLGEYFEDGNTVYGNVRITLSNKGASVGPVVLSLPNVVGAFLFVPPVITGFGLANMAALSGPLTGYCPTSTATCNLLVQGAAAAVALANTNLTNTSDFQVSFLFSK